MKVNYLFFSLLIIFLSSGRHIEKKKVQNLALLGSWTMSSDVEFNNKGQGITTTYNVCPIIIFNNDGFGKTNRDFFEWHSDGKKLTINYFWNKNKEGPVIKGGTYGIKYTDKKTYLEAILTDSSTKVLYFLGKGK